MCLFDVVCIVGLQTKPLEESMAPKRTLATYGVGVLLSVLVRASCAEVDGYGPQEVGLLIRKLNII